MVKQTTNRNHGQSEMQLEFIEKLSNLALFGGSLHIAGDIYSGIKRSNSFMNWGLATAEQSLIIATTSALPAILILNKPISTLDNILCRGIDIIEQRVPAVHLPPHLLYWNTREFMNNKIIRPIWKRAGSISQISSQAANAAADTLDGALTVADIYIDHYLPGDPMDKSVEDVKSEKSTSKTVRTFEHGARFSKKLQRRLTRRTLAEARALKHQGVECYHVLLYIAKLIVTDPKMAYQKAVKLWAYLSRSEPENQVRPGTLEELMVLLTRESARRVVHLVNASARLASVVPRKIGVNLIGASHWLLSMVDVTLKMAPFTRTREIAASEIFALEGAVHNLSISATTYLERTAIFLAGRPKPKKLTSRVNNQRNYRNHHSNLIENHPSNGTDQ